MPRTPNRTPLAHPVADAAACERYDCGHVARSTDRNVRAAGILLRVTLAHGAGVVPADTPDAVLTILGLMRQGVACRDLAARYSDPVTGRRVAAAPRRERTTLTDKQAEVLRALARGATTAEAADTLYLSEGTVKNHVTYAYRALGVHSLGDAIAEAMRQGVTIF